VPFVDDHGGPHVLAAEEVHLGDQDLVGGHHDIELRQIPELLLFNAVTLVLGA
jgi:hypothetical protein